jgi:hypothetical protein
MAVLAASVPIYESGLEKKVGKDHKKVQGLKMIATQRQ